MDPCFSAFGCTDQIDLSIIHSHIHASRQQLIHLVDSRFHEICSHSIKNQIVLSSPTAYPINKFKMLMRKLTDWEIKPNLELDYDLTLLGMILSFFRITPFMKSLRLLLEFESESKEDDFLERYCEYCLIKTEAFASFNSPLVLILAANGSMFESNRKL